MLLFDFISIVVVIIVVYVIAKVLGVIIAVVRFFTGARGVQQPRTSRQQRQTGSHPKQPYGNNVEDVDYEDITDQK